MLALPVVSICSFWTLLRFVASCLQTFAILTKYTCRILTYLQSFDILNPPLFWQFCTILTNLHHLNTEFQKKSKQIILVVCKGTSRDCRQSKQSEFTVLLSILRYVSELDIVIVTFSFCSIVHCWLLATQYLEKVCTWI